LDWPVVRVGAGPPWTVDVGRGGPGGGLRLRVTVGIDIRRGVQIDVLEEPSGRKIGVLDLSFATALQQVQARLDVGSSGGLKSLRLRAAGDEAVYLLSPEVPEPAMRPHVLEAPGGSGGLGGGSFNAFAAHLCSGASRTQYGWMEGCVLDALADFAGLGVPGAAAAWGLHLEHYFTADGVRYENFRSQRRCEVQGTETTNMFAGLARRRPDHPAVDAVLRFFDERADADAEGIIRDGAVVAEHNMTVAYPLAVIGAARGEAQRMDQALAQLMVRRQRLDRADGLYLRSMDDGRLTFRHWARGVTWYLLGLVRTLAVLEDAGWAVPGVLRSDVGRLAGWLAGLQRPDGLWSCFVDEPETGAETSGSAGIAAALASAAVRGWAGPEARASAGRCAEGLRAWIEPDGLPGGMSPSNKREAGPEVQRSGQRVMGGAATGLIGQLLAALAPGAAGPGMAIPGL
jgi:hypothetical protein